MRFVAIGAVLGAAACGGVERPVTEAPRTLEVGIEPRLFVLPNGLHAILIPDRTADFVNVLVRYRAGAIDEPDGQAGVAHLAAHVVYSQRARTRTLWAELDRSAFWVNTFPRDAETDFVEETRPEQLGEVLRLEAQRLALGCRTVADEDFARERWQVVEELRANTSRLANRAVAHAMLDNHDPYFRRYDATPEAVIALGRDQVCAFVDAHYGPDNTILVVSGPIEPDAFGALLDADLAHVPRHPLVARATWTRPSENGSRTTFQTDVAATTVAIGWPLPAEEGERTLTLWALGALATAVHASSFHDDELAILWLPDNASGATLTIERVQTALRTSLIPAADFERARTQQVTRYLMQLDRMQGRLEQVIRDPDLAAPFDALEKLTADSFDAFVAKTFAWSRARVVVLEPDGTRAAWHPATLSDPIHSLRGPPVEIDLEPTDPPSAKHSAALARAKTFKLANGLSVILVPTSQVPIVDIRLEFGAGTAAEPSDHRGTATTAISALHRVALRGPDTSSSKWTEGMERTNTGLDSSSINVIGPTMYADVLMNRFQGLAASKLDVTDATKSLPMLASVAAKPHRTWDEQAAVREAVYGADHPYARMRAPTSDDVAKFDVREVEAYIARYLQPSNATLIVTGGFNVDKLAEQVHRVFDGWQGSGERIRFVPVAGKPTAFASADHTDRVMLRIVWNGGAMDDAFPARKVLGNLLHIVSYRVSADYTQLAQAGTYWITGTFDPANAPREIAWIQHEIPLVANGSPFSRTTFAAALRRVTGAQIGGPWSADAWASYVAWAAVGGRDVSWLQQLQARYARVTFDDVARLATQEVSLDRATWFISGPHDAVAAVYAWLGIQPVWLNEN